MIKFKKYNIGLILFSNIQSIVKFTQLSQCPLQQSFSYLGSDIVFSWLIFLAFFKLEPQLCFVFSFTMYFLFFFPVFFFFLPFDLNIEKKPVFFSVSKRHSLSFQTFKIIVFYLPFPYKS